MWVAINVYPTFLFKKYPKWLIAIKMQGCKHFDSTSITNSDKENIDWYYAGIRGQTFTLINQNQQKQESTPVYRDRWSTSLWRIKTTDRWKEVLPFGQLWNQCIVLVYYTGLWHEYIVPNSQPHFSKMEAQDLIHKGIEEHKRTYKST